MDVAFVVEMFVFPLRLKQMKTAPRMDAKKTKPPTIPPTIAPTLTAFFSEADDVDDEPSTKAVEDGKVPDEETDVEPEEVSDECVPKDWLGQEDEFDPIELI